MNALEKETTFLSEPAVIREEVLGNGHIIYKIIKTNVLIENQPICVYGIQVTSTLFAEKEISTIKDVSTKFEVVNELFEIIVQNMVLPCTLQDIAYDFLVTKY